MNFVYYFYKKCSSKFHEDLLKGVSEQDWLLFGKIWREYGSKDPQARSVLESPFMVVLNDPLEGIVSKAGPIYFDLVLS